MIITAYLSACVLVFVFLLLMAGLNFIRINNFRKQVISLEEKFQGSSKKRNISEYNEEMRIEITKYLNKLKAIDGVISKDIDPTQILQRISKTLPKGYYVDDFSLDNNKKTLDFNIVSPIGEKGESLDISGLIAMWKKDEDLMSAIENITSSHSQKQKKYQSTVLISQFSCTLSKGGS